MLAIQVNFIINGILLNIVPHHMAMDGSGTTQVLKLLSTVLSGKAIPRSDLVQANRDRSQVIPLLADDEPMRDCSHLRRPGYWKPAASKTPPRWCMYQIPLLNLPALRQLAAGKDASLVSDNDILCAFCWQRLSVGRIARGIPQDSMVKFTRAIDGRTALGVPSSYIGHMIHHSIVSLTLDEVANSSLNVVASALRRELNATNTSWAIRSYATFIAREKDRSRLVFGGLRDINLDLGATSVVAGAGDDAAKSAPDTYGPLGSVQFVRRPRVTPIAGTITITPAEAGALPITLCLPESDLEFLKTDAEWNRYMEHIG